MYNLKNFDCQCSEIFCNYHHFALFYNFLVRHNRLLNSSHEVNKLLHYGNKHSKALQ